ncbi:hypothetical protein PORY_001763 [Pneumocystis oryctolagi]|uniref:Uncharacterized protein n=1 Tax=Pneumocystis oryctolagi TaxID=42067 RepID=A0ACB7CBD9_9ASCO|nr:hypothetical protein PORY_001763 [Pneumocystis oryctolagi]
MIQEADVKEVDIEYEDIKKAKDVIYCGVCSFPPEYCEFGDSSKKCMKWLEDNYIDIYNKLYSQEIMSIRHENMTLEEKKMMEEEIKKKHAKEDAKTEKELKKNMLSKVVIKKNERNKRKYVISVQGLELFGIDIKKAAKLFGKKFATGSSVTKNASGVDELVVQGDYIDEIYNYIIETYPEIPESNIDCRHKEIQKINECKNYFKSMNDHDINFKCIDFENKEDKNVFLDYSTYIKIFCEKSTQYSVLLFFLQRYEKMKRSLLYLSKKYKKEKKIWKEYINHKMNQTKASVLYEGQNISTENMEMFFHKENISFASSRSIDKMNSDLSKISLDSSKPLELIDSSKVSISPSSSAVYEFSENSVLNDQKNTSYTTLYYNDSTTDDDDETEKLCPDSKDEKFIDNNIKTNEEEKYTLSLPLTFNSTLENSNDSCNPKEDKDIFSELSFTENAPISQDVIENPTILNSESTDKKKIIQHTFDSLLTPNTNSKSTFQNNKSPCEKEENKEDMSCKIVPIFDEHRLSILTQSLTNKVDNISEKNNSNNINNSTSTLSEKENHLIQENSFIKNEHLQGNIVLEKDSSNSGTDLKRLGRYSRASKSTKESLHDYVINIDKNNNIPYAYDEVIRDKASRKRLPACACDNCIKFFEAHGPIATIPKPKWRSPPKECAYIDLNKEHIHQNLQQVSRHRAIFFRAKTPPGFWESDFPNTQQEQDYRKQAEIQNYEKLKERKLEAERGGRWKRKT